MDLDKLTKEELVGELTRRGEDVRGRKPVLLERLRELLKEEEFQSQGARKQAKEETDKLHEECEPKKADDGKSVKSGSSRSGGGSAASSKPASSVRTSVSIVSARALERARLAGLSAKKEALKKRHQLEEEEAALRKKREELEIQAEIDESEAKEKVLEEMLKVEHATRAASMYDCQAQTVASLVDEMLALPTLRADDGDGLDDFGIFLRGCMNALENLPHGGKHQIENCKKFESRTHEERSKFVKEKGLCFACLQHGHRSRFCKERRTCERCNRSHPTVLHEDRISPTPSATTGHLAPSGAGGAKLQVLKVMVGLDKETVVTNAFLDSGSTHSFISKHLLQKMKVTPQNNSSLRVCTIRGEAVMDSCLVPGLVIRSLDGDNCMELPPLYVLDHIPVTSEDIPSEEDGPPETWPSDPEAGEGVSEHDPEVKTSTCLSSVEGNADAVRPMKRLVNHYSTWRRLTRAVAWIRRVLRMLRDKKRGGIMSSPAELSVQEIADAEKLIILSEQEASFPQEMKDLRAGKETRAGRSTRSTTNMKPGDIVLMVDDAVPRGTWPLGRVEAAPAAADGRVRTVWVRVRGTTYARPITKVVKIIGATEAE
ncbi:hypothetical protein FJT64_026562 [Amphibalanus amphitrite]|uniref:SAP domain-containing protein n=1 Tax=Amphibalanus amphitrite TaxID=1232801 RepID=A0A6A4WDV5_AMPAM|nr:hypothetical protein FJT64_026562 [Amphibalanus amphitrite]